MLYQDTLTGALHEVPDAQVAGYGEEPYGVGEGQMVYDGLGNPLGFSFKRAFSSLGKLALKAAPMMGPYGMLVSRAVPMISRAMSPARPPQSMPNQAPPQLVQQQMEPQSEGGEVGEMPMGYRRPGMYPMSMRPPTPARWIPASPAHWSRPTPPVYGPRSPLTMRPPFPAGWKRPEIPYTGIKPRRVYMRCAVWRGPGGLVPINPGQPAIAPPVVAPGAPMHHRRSRRHRR